VAYRLGNREPFGSKGNNVVSLLIPYEEYRIQITSIGNAFSAMFKQNRITLEEAEKGLSIFMSIPIRYIDPDFVRALKLSKQANIYAYDAYLLDCAIRHKAPLLTLDRKLKTSAQNLNVETMEV
jgi:predicted nucleic acid-binding protein